MRTIAESKAKIEGLGYEWGYWHTFGEGWIMAKDCTQISPSFAGDQRQTADEAATFAEKYLKPQKGQNANQS